MDIDYQMIGTRIRTPRTTNNLTQEELAFRINTSPSYICHIENGRKKPSLKKLMEIAAVFNVTLDEFLYSSAQLYGLPSGLKDIISGYSDHDKEILIQFMSSVISSAKN
jgi:transcriptional regulator with XRE-family HTH domain